jgi:hypothetical protein
MIVNGTIEDFWWCGLGKAPGLTNDTDVIYHAVFDKTSATWSAPSIVLTPDASHWDGVFTCDPSVVRGRFNNPDDGHQYAYAIYYTGASNPNGPNFIGVAFSDDGLTWKKYSGNPVISPQDPFSTSYGAGQPAVYNADGNASIVMMHTDTSTANGDRLWERTSSDGISFSSPILLNNVASDGTILCTNADLGYDYASDVFYGAIANCNFQRAGEQDKFQFGLYSMDGAKFRDGTGTWHALGVVNSALTGFELNHSPGFRRNGYGDITPWLPSIALYFAGGDASPTTWDLTLVTWSPSPATLPLKRYAKYPEGHWVTTGFVSPGYELEQTLGFIFMAKNEGTEPLYACTTLDAKHHLLSRDVGCEGQKPEGIVGWLYASAGHADAPTAIFRCATVSGDHFVSSDASCEGAVVENGGSPLGWARSAP